MSKLFSVLLAAAIVCAVGVVPASANTPPKARDAATEGPASGEAAPEAGAPRAGEAKAALLKLVADAKADRAARAPSPQLPRPQQNNLNRGQKIAIGVGIAAAALLITYLVIRAKCDGLCT